MTRLIRVRPEPATRPTLHLFAYGTLRPGLAPEEIAPIVAQLSALGEGFMFGKLYDLGNYPGAVIDPASAWIIYGTVYALPQDAPDVLRALDAYEGDEFVRIAQLVTLTEGRVLDCWVYDYKGQPGEDRFIKSGRWMSPRKS
jgi:gamma-glutamylcyclotransferase (GGCT)/AIG2-like uncharacterized protein YtfP